MSPSPPKDGRPAKDLVTLKVLLVDDNVNVQQLIGDVLRAAGVGRVDTARDGARARDKIASFDPDVIFSDWHMPVLGGLELTRQVRRAAICPDRRVPNPQVPVILVTGRCSEAEVQIAREAGVDEFVMKPFTAAALLARLQLVLLKPRPFVVSEAYIGPDRRRRAEPDYAGPLRRASDPVELADAALAAMRASLDLELSAVRGLIRQRGLDGETVNLTYRAMQQACFRSHQVRDTAVQRAAVLLMEYIEAMGAPEHCQLEVFNVYFQAIHTLLNTTAVEMNEAATVLAHLEAVARHKVAQKRVA